ncbi:MAG TPA: hypothetical protein VK813_15690 [Edaphobacter sp.]|nr:hypothetical protein [Edaphobacter sp.]
MNSPVPSFLFPFILWGTAATLAALLFGLNRSLKRANWSASSRGKALLSTAAALAIFYVAAVLPARSGFYHFSASRIPTIQYGILSPIAIGVLVFVGWRPFRRLVEAVPQQWIVGLQLYRAEGVIFLVLLAMGRLPREFAIPAGVGDVVVGLCAPLVATAVVRNWRHATTLLRVWNLLGILDLTVAVTMGLLTSPSPIHLLAVDRPNELISLYPLVMVPVFLVPLAILLHLASLQKLRQAKSTQETMSEPLVGRHA